MEMQLFALAELVVVVILVVVIPIGIYFILWHVDEYFTRRGLKRRK